MSEESRDETAEAVGPVEPVEPAPPETPAAVAAWRLPPWLEALAVAAILVMAAGLRLYALESAPPGLWFDEGLAGLNALTILHIDSWRVYSDNREYFGDSPAFGEEPMFHYLLAFAIRVGGRSALTLRATSAVIGLLTVLALYGMARVIWGPGMALLAAFLLASLRWHVHFSRLAFRTILVPLFACLFLLLWWRGVATGRLRYLVPAGIVLGLGFYTYPAFQLVFAAWVLLWLWRLARERANRRALLWGFAWPVLVAVVVAMPLLHYFYEHPDVAGGRVASLTLFEKGWQPGLRLLAEQAWDNVRHFWWRGDHVPKHNVPLMPVFDPITGAVFALGLLVTLAGAWRDARNALLLLWVACVAVASIFSFGSPNLLRTLAMTPAVVLILANGYVLLARTIGRTTTRHVAAVALIGLLGWFGAIEAHRYFVVWAHHPLVPRDFNTAERRLAEALLTVERDAPIHMAPELANHPSIRFLLYGRPNVQEIRIPDSFVRSAEGWPRDRVLAYWHGFWQNRLPGAAPSSDLPVVLFPQGWFVWRSPDDVLKAYRIPATSLMTWPRAVELVERLEKPRGAP